MHHGEEQSNAPRGNPEMEARMKQLTEQLQLGATGHYPEGALNEVDEGEIKIAIGIEDGKVVINFGKPVAWIGFNPKQALELAESVRQAAHRVRKGG